MSLQENKVKPPDFIDGFAGLTQVTSVKFTGLFRSDHSTH
jgi:hypothetical protein